ncbi:MAG: helix-turn-helix domain-containing protein [Bacteroidota bacterium]
MKRLFFLLTLIFCVLANAQITQQQLSSVSVDSLKNGFNTYQTTNLETAKEYLKALLTRTEKGETSLKTYELLFRLSDMYMLLQKQDSALYYIDIAIEKVEKNELLLSDYVHMKGGIYYEFGDYTKAAEYYSKANEIAKQNNDLSKQADIANDIALIKTQIGDNIAALQLIKKNLSFYEKRIQQEGGDAYTDAYVNALVSISDIYTNLFIDKRKSDTKYLDSAQYYNTIAIAKTLQHNYDLRFAISLRLKGILHHEEGNIEQSTIDLIKAEELFQQLKLPKRLLILYLYRGKNYYALKNFEKALSYFKKTETLIEETKADFPDLQELYILMAKSYEQKDDSENAIKYHNLFHQHDARNDDLKQQSQEKLYEKYDIVAFEDTIDSLKNDLTKSTYKYSIILGCMLLLVIGIVLYYKRKQAQNKKQFQKIIEELEFKNAKKSPQKKLNISQENISKILKGLEEFEKNELFLKKNCSLNFVANKINTNSTYLSKVIQIHKQKKFIQYITDLRIDYALERLTNDKKFRAYNIKSIASELGYNSAESFSKDFKRRTKLYPSYYIKQINESTKE